MCKRYIKSLGSFHFTTCRLPVRLVAELKRLGIQLCIWREQCRGCNKVPIDLIQQQGRGVDAQCGNNHNYGTSLELDGKLYMFGGMNHFSQTAVWYSHKRESAVFR